LSASIDAPAFGSVLVTGGLGAIGSYVTASLLATGSRVTTFSRSADLSTLRLLADESHLRRLTVVQGDLLHKGEVARAIADTAPQLIVALSSMLIPASNADPLSAYDVNLGGVLQCLDAAQRYDVPRVVVASAKAAYGVLPPGYRSPAFRPVTEDLRFPPGNIYGLTKRAAEDVCGYYRSQRGVEVACLRLGSTYGPGKDKGKGKGKGKGNGMHQSYSSLKSRIVEAAALGRDVVVRGADVVDDLVYNRDVAKAVLCAAAVDPAGRDHLVYNVSGGALVSMREFVAEVARCCPDSRVEFVESDESASTGLRLRMDISLAAREIGYVPDFPGTAGVSDYVAVIRTGRGGVMPAAGEARLELAV
jgi:nucleoside-diphosphate-sugar epimerase